MGWVKYSTIGAKAGTDLKDSSGNVLADTAVKNSSVALSLSGTGLTLTNAGSGVTLGKANVGLNLVDNTSDATTLAGNLTGKVNNVAVATVQAGAAAGATANQDSTATILGGELTGSLNSTSFPMRAMVTGANAAAVKTTIALENVNNTSDATVLAATHTGAVSGNVTGKVNNVAVATISSGAASGATANQDSTATILGGNLTGKVNNVAVATVQAGAASGATANQDSTATILGGTHTGAVSGNVTGKVNNVAVATISSGAASGATANQDSTATILGGTFTGTVGTGGPSASNAATRLGKITNAGEFSGSLAAAQFPMRGAITAANQGAARTALGAGTSSFSGSAADLTGDIDPDRFDAGDFPMFGLITAANATAVNTLTGSVTAGDMQWGTISVTAGAISESWSTEDQSSYLPNTTTETGTLSITHPTLGSFTSTYTWTRTGLNVSNFGVTTGSGNSAFTAASFGSAATTKTIVVTHTASSATISMSAFVIDLSNLGGCLLPGSMIKHSNGETPIEEIEVGTKVIAYNETTGKEVEAEIFDKAPHKADFYYKVNDLQLTSGHPIWANDGWSCVDPVEYKRECIAYGHTLDLEPNKLGVGDVLYDGTLVEKIERVDEATEVWNIIIKDIHTYIANGILVHNGGGGGGGKCLTPAMLPEGLEVGDEIDSPVGKTKVVKIVEKQREGYYILEDELEITNDHPILIEGEWILAEEYQGKKEYIDEPTEVIYVETENELLTVKGWTVGGKY